MFRPVFFCNHILQKHKKLARRTTFGNNFPENFQKQTRPQKVPSKVKKLMAKLFMKIQPTTCLDITLVLFRLPYLLTWIWPAGQLANLLYTCKSDSLYSPTSHKPFICHYLGLVLSFCPPKQQARYQKFKFQIRLINYHFDTQKKDKVKTTYTLALTKQHLQSSSHPFKCHYNM